MRRFAVIGNPVKHSLSPQIHHYFARKHRIRLNYHKIHTDDFVHAVNGFFLNGGSGLNVTVPFKQQAFQLAAKQTKRCQLAKAVNTLWLNQHQQLCADNTDGAGLVRDLKRYGSLKNKKILMIGAGGAARGVIPVLQYELPYSLDIVNRHFDKADTLAKEFNLTARRVDDELSGYDLVINATSSSLTYQRPEVNIRHFARNSIAYDMVYQREPTVFMEWANSLGVGVSLDGLGMLVEQAAESFAIWCGVMPSPTTRMSILQQLRLAL